MDSAHAAQMGEGEGVAHSAFGSWVEDVAPGTPFASDKTQRAHLFWAKCLTGLPEAALHSIGAHDAASTMSELPSMAEVPLAPYTTMVAGLSKDAPLLTMVASTYGALLAESQKRLSTLLRAPVATHDMARLLLLGLHEHGQMSWNKAMPETAKVDASTMFTAARELDALHNGVCATTYGMRGAATKALLESLLGA